MKTIYKYKLLLDDVQTVEMPVGANILSAQMQNGELCLWAEVDDEKPTEYRSIWIYGTGHLMDDALVRYISTVQDRSFVWHVYEELA